MFKCRNCNKPDKFELMLSPEYKGKKEVSKTVNEHNQIVITVDGYTFVPDLAFMNGHAVCKYCGEINKWELS